MSGGLVGWVKRHYYPIGVTLICFLLIPFNKPFITPVLIAFALIYILGYYAGWANRGDHEKTWQNYLEKSRKEYEAISK